MSAEELSHAIDRVYEDLEGRDDVMAYDLRHEIQSLGILTIDDHKGAATVADYLASRIRDKVVIEIGAGVGLLAVHLAKHARRVFAIEADPSWSWIFLRYLYRDKPKNLSWLFGSADEFAGMLRGDVAIFCTRSGRDSMRKAAELFVPAEAVIDVWGFLKTTRRGGE